MTEFENVVQEYMQTREDTIGSIVDKIIDEGKIIPGTLTDDGGFSFIASFPSKRIVVSFSFSVVFEIVDENISNKFEFDYTEHDSKLNELRDFVYPILVLHRREKEESEKEKKQRERVEKLQRKIDKMRSFSEHVKQL